MSYVFFHWRENVEGESDVIVTLFVSFNVTVNMSLSIWLSSVCKCVANPSPEYEPFVKRIRCCVELVPLL